MVTAVSRSANSQNTIQPADFTANDPFPCDGRIACEQYLASGSQWAVVLRARPRQLRRRRAEERLFEGAEQRRFAERDAEAKALFQDRSCEESQCRGRAAHLVSFGNQKNFQPFMQAMKEQYPEGFSPDEAWFKSFVSKAILFRTVQAIVKARKFPAYQANIAAYTVACISWKSGGRIDFERIGAHQALSPECRR